MRRMSWSDVSSASVADRAGCLTRATVAPGLIGRRQVVLRKPA